MTKGLQWKIATLVLLVVGWQLFQEFVLPPTMPLRETSENRG